MSDLYRTAMRKLSDLGPQEWFLLLLCVLVVGAFFLRGFGSRSRY
jgi:hypothetical protein